MQKKDVLAGLPRNHQIIIGLTSGAIAGGVAKSMSAPLDRAKVNFQISPQMQYNLKNVFQFIYASYQQNGILEVWRGNSATVARTVPFAAITYMAHDQYKRLFGISGTKKSTKNSSFKSEVTNVLLHFAAGALAGVTAESVTYPLDRARTMMFVSHKEEYRNIGCVFKAIIRKEGYLSLYRGFSPTVMGLIPYKGIGFLVFEKLKSISLQQQVQLSPTLRFTYGATAGICGTIVSYPFETVRRRMQAQDKVMLHGYAYKSVFNSLLHILKTEGFRFGLYKGITMNFIKNPIGTGISFMLNDYCQIVLVRIYNTM